MSKSCERCEILLPAAVGLISGAVAFTLMSQGASMARFPSSATGSNLRVQQGNNAEVLERIDDLKWRLDALTAGSRSEMNLPAVSPKPSVGFEGGAAAGKLMSPEVLQEFESKAEAAYWYQTVERDPEKQRFGPFSNFMANWPCMWGEALIGKGIGDGSKWMCGAHMIREPCVVYSVGSNGNYKFETGIKALGLNCDIHIYDPTYGQEGITKGPGWTYHKVGLSNKDRYPYMTLKSLMKENGHTFIDVLKVDIEGAEHPVISQLAADGWPSVGQFMVEAHKNTFTSSEKLGQWIRNIEAAGLRMFHLELNFHSACCMEYAFIHKNWRPEIKKYTMNNATRSLL